MLVDQVLKHFNFFFNPEQPDVLNSFRSYVYMNRRAYYLLIISLVNHYVVRNLSKFLTYVKGLPVGRGLANSYAS